MLRCAPLLLLLVAALAAAQDSTVQPPASPPETSVTSTGVPETSSKAVPAPTSAAAPAAVPATAPDTVPAAAPQEAPSGGDDDDELTERQTLSKAATVLCRTSPRGKNDPNVRGFAYTNNRCVALCRNGYGIPWRQSFTAQTSCGSGMVCVNRECMQAGTSKDMQTCTTIFNQSRRKFKQLFNFRVEAGVISACRLRCYNPNTAESLRVNRDDGERCQNRLYEGTCRGGVCRSPNEAIAAIGSVIPIPYQEANAFSNPNDHNVEVEEPGFGDEFAHDGFPSDRFEDGFGGRPVQTRFPAVPVHSAAAVPETNGTLIA
ncbi:uncharacterized protein LOC119399925 [Rhipicephalus sanguineus]|uniref:uncharacterized protein LOC119399925 n=1 Tax=Rhipicephalus sanguineus TaxID=34632 RepID=UPI0018935732|nr:uncharacterized protein LOC119399925 [Rhipicephalus sanguineus]